MSATATRRGGAPVGFVADLPDIEAGAVLYLRLWSDGPEGQANVWSDFARTLGPDHGRAALRAFEHLCTLAGSQGRRPLMRHAVSCKCLGADECVFANIVAAASTGDREDATMLASLIVRPDMADGLARLAEQFGLALRRMLIRSDDAVGPCCPAASRRLH